MKESLSIGIEDQLFKTSVICVVRETQCNTLEDDRMTPWTKMLYFVHWL
jgi:hypothetical protein